jgi:hypothetical protein
MSRLEKLKDKILRLPRNFTFDELVILLKGYGYAKHERGRTSGSAVMFYNQRSGDKIMIHKPHPEKEVKIYVLRLVIEKLHIKKVQS